MADCFKFRNKIGLDVAVEALRDCRRRRGSGLDKVARRLVEDLLRPVDLEAPLGGGTEEHHEREDIGEAEPAVLAGLARRDASLVDEADQVLAGDVEKIGRLLGRQVPTIHGPRAQGLRRAATRTGARRFPATRCFGARLWPCNGASDSSASKA
jgi:hypothetical protein